MKIANEQLRHIKKYLKKPVENMTTKQTSLWMYTISVGLVDIQEIQDARKTKTGFTGRTKERSNIG